MSKNIFYLLLGLALSFYQNGYAQKKNSLHYTDTIAQAFYKKAIYYKKRYQYDSAYIYLNKSLTYANKKDNQLKARIYNKFAVINYYNYDLASSEFYCIKALKFLPDDDVYRSNIYSLLALIATAKADYPAAITYNKKAYNIGKQRKDTLEAYVKFHNNLGNLYRKQKKFPEAMVHYNKILELDDIANRFPNKYARALANKAKTMLLYSGQKEQALSLLLRSLAIRKKTQNTGGISGVYIYLSDYYYRIGDLQKSKEYALKSLEIAQKANLPYIVLKAYKRVIKADSLHRGYYFNKFSKLQDSLINKERQYKEQSARIRYESFKKDKEIHEQKMALERRKRTMIFMSIILLLVFGGGSYSYKQKNRIAQQFKELEQHKTQIEDKNTLLQHKKMIITHLQKEIHHRLKNNFGKIDGYIEDIIEKNDANPELIAQLETLKSRVANISAIHLQLYQSEDVTRFALKPHVDTIFELNKFLFAKSEVVLNNKISKHLLFDVNQSFILSMIINEFITNSFKYAFDEDVIGNISVYCYAEGKGYILKLADDGKGLPEDFDFKNDIGYGLEMMQLWAKELGGKIEIYTHNGFSVKLDFPGV